MKKRNNKRSDGSYRTLNSLTLTYVYTGTDHYFPGLSSANEVLMIFRRYPLLIIFCCLGNIFEQGYDHIRGLQHLCCVQLLVGNI